MKFLGCFVAVLSILSVVFAQTPFNVQNNSPSTNINFKFASLFEYPSKCDLPPLKPVTRPPLSNFQLQGLPDLLSLAVSQGLTTFAKLITAANLTTQLKTSRLTVFAPTNGAFSALGKDGLAKFFQYPQRFLQILQYHQVSGPLLSNAIRTSSTLKTLEGESIVVTAPTDETLVDGNILLRKDLSASNGILHVVPQVLIPPSLRSKWILPTLLDDGYLSFVQAVFAASANLTYEPPNVVTVFAPTEEAFQKLGTIQLNELLSDPVELRKYVLHHTVPGIHLSSSFVNGKTFATLAGTTLTLNIRNLQWRVNDVLIRKFDVMAFNGVYHEIDTVLNPNPVQTVFDLLSTLGLGSFANALTTSGAASQLSSSGPWTLFAPTDDALSTITLPTDLNRLKGQLLYHVVGGVVSFDNVTFPFSLPSQLNNRDDSEPLNFTRSNENIVINGISTVTLPGVKATNGIVYIIDKFIPTTVLDPKSIGATLLREGLTTTYAAYNNSGLLSILASQDITLFAPTNEAWEKALPPGYTLETLFSSPGVLQSILFYQVATSRLTTTFLKTGILLKVPTLLQDQSLNVNLQLNKLMINGASIVSADIQSTNGVVHAVNQVLYPTTILPQTVWETISRSVEFQPWADIVSRAGYSDFLQNGANFTLFVPSRAALATASIEPTQVVPIVQYHLLNGIYNLLALRTAGSVLTLQGSSLDLSSVGLDLFVEDARVTRSDIRGTNGIIQVIDSVLFPTSIFPLTVTDTIRSKSLTSFADLITVAKLTDTLALVGPYTVLAPTNAAFDSLDPSLIGQIRSDPAAARNFVLNHVLSEYYPSSKLPSVSQSLSGENITISTANGTVTFTSVAGTVAKLVQSNLYAQNGVVHSIDKVLLPVNLIPRSVQDLIVANPNLTTFRTLLTQSGVAANIFGPVAGSITVFAPTNAAITAALAGPFASKFNDPVALNLIISYHIVVNSFPTAFLTNGLSISTLSQGALVNIINQNGVIRLQSNRSPPNFANLVSVNATANSPTNAGVLHTLDAVLIPAGI